MPTLTELHEKRGRLVTEARTALEEIKTNTDDARRTELEQRHNTIMAEYDTANADIEREERVAKIEREEEEHRARKRPIGDDTEATFENGDDTKATEQRQREYRTAYKAWLRSGCDATELSSEHRALLRKGHQALAGEQRVQVAGTAVAGGYTVPKSMADQIVRTMKDWGPMYDEAVCNVVTTGSGNEFDIPTNDDTGNSTTSGLAEGADLVDDNSGDVAFGQARLDAYVDATPWIKIGFELMQDSLFDIEGFVGEAIGSRIGRRTNVRLTTGTGSSQPNGVATAAPVGVTTASATAFTGDEVLKLFHSVNAAYRRNPKCRWMFADTTLLALRLLKDGQGNYLWQMGDVRAGAPDTFSTKPYSINDDVAAVATAAKSILFGDFSKYWVRKVGAPLIGNVRERFWPKIGLAGLVRYDGELVDAAAIKALKHA